MTAAGRRATTSAPAAVETRWRAARDAGVDFIATRPGPRAWPGSWPVRPPSRRRHPRPRRSPRRRSARASQGRGVTLLPNGWRISPAGRHLQAGDFPLSMTASPDRRYLIVSNNGWSTPSLTVVDTQRWAIKAKVPVEHAWLGLAWDAAGKRLYSAGAAENTVHVFDYAAGALKQGTPLVVAPPALRLPPGTTDMVGTGFVGGIATAADGRTLYAVHVFGRAISAIDLGERRGAHHRDLAGRALHRRPGCGRAARLRLAVGRRQSPRARRGDAGGNRRGRGRRASRTRWRCRRTGSACSSPAPTRTRCGCSTRPTLIAREQIGVSPFPEAPPGTTPNALAVSPDGETLAVANADNNTDRHDRHRAAGPQRGRGLHPDRLVSDRRCCSTRPAQRLFVLSGKGLIGQANPRGPASVSPTADGQYAGQLLQGTVSVIDVPDAAGLAAHTARVVELSAYTDAKKLTPAGAPAASPIPRRVGDPSPIKHVFYVIRENRTYDQILGDLEQGNGDPTLAIFGEEVTPNAHALAREFVLFDNFYVDAEVSYDGHAFSTGAYATDVVEKLWPTNYGRRGGVYLSEGGYGDRNPYGNLSAPSDGYIWDFATRAGVSVRSYGEFADWAGTNPTARGASRRASRARGQGPSDLSALRPVGPRRQAHRRVAGGVPALRGERRAAAAEHHPAGQRSHLRHAAGRADAARRWWRRTTSRWAGWSRRSAAAGSGTNRRSSCSRTTPRTGPTTSTRTVRRRSSSARSRSAARSTARSTPRPACCGRWS